jgi:putative membrane protein
MAEAAGSEGPRRLHWSSMLSTLGAGARSMWGLFAGGAYFAASGQWLLVAGVLGATLVFSIIGAIVGWRTFTYRPSGDEIRIDSGLLNRKHRSIPFDRIQDAEISQGPVARLLGVARVKLETGGSSGDKDEGVLQAVLLAEAEALRQLVRARRSGLAFDPHPDSDQPEEEQIEAAPLYAMDTRRLVIAGTFNFSLAVFAGLAGLTQTFGDVLGFDPFRRGFWREMESTIGPFAAIVLAHQVTAVIAGIAVVALLGLATGIVRTILRDYGFRIDRTPAGLRRRRGLLTRSDVTLQVRRVQAAVIGSGPVRFHFGWCDLKLQSLAQDESGKDDHIVAPLASDDEVDTLLAEISVQPVGAVSNWQPVSRAYFTAFLMATSPLYVAALAQGVFAPWIGAAFALLIAGVQGTRFIAWKRTAYVRDGDRLLVRRGWWRRRLTILPARNIQTLDLNESFISRWFGVASLEFGVAGGSGHSVPAIPRERARQLRSELLSSAT